MILECKLSFMGDIMCQRAILDPFRTDCGYDFHGMFEGCRSFFDESDFVCGNLETPISISGGELTCEKYSFNAPFEFAEAVKDAGVDFVAAANNHCLDRGIPGISSTINSLEKSGLLFTGIRDRKRDNYVIADVNGIRLGIISYTYGTNAFSNGVYLPRRDYWRVNLFQNQELSCPLDRFTINNPRKFISRAYKKVLRKIYNVNENRQPYERVERSLRCRLGLKRNIRKMLKDKPDVTICYLHAGGQYNASPMKETVSMAERLHKYGIDLVVCSHEHVVHGGDFTKIPSCNLSVYSLGNFCSTNGVVEEPFDVFSEYSIVLNVYLKKEGEKTEIKKTSFSIMKCIASEGGKIKTVPAFDLYEQSGDPEILEDMKKIAFSFSGKEVNTAEREYTILQ